VTLRRRLTIAFGALVLLPLVAGGIFVGWAIPRAADQRAEAALHSAQSSVDASLIARCDRAGIAARSLGQSLALMAPARATRVIVTDRLASYAVIFDQGGRVVAAAGTAPPGTATASHASCREGSAAGAGLSETANLAISGAPHLARSLAVEDVSQAYLDELRSQLGITPEIALVRDGHVVASTGTGRLDLSEAAVGIAAASIPKGQVQTVAGIRGTATSHGPGLPFDVVVGLPVTNNTLLLQTVLLVIVGGMLVAVVTARAIARDLTEPLAELTEAARSAATGDLTRKIDARGDAEIRSLAQSFNDMTDELRTYILEVERSRDLVRGNVERLGEALSATHDLATLLPVVLESALAAVGAGAGVVYVAEGGGPMEMQAHHGLRVRELGVPQQIVSGVGLLGRVADGQTLCGDIGETVDLAPGSGEQLHGSVLAVPLRRGEHVSGVIALFDPVLAGRFVRRDVDELQTLARQAAIAVENVQLHTEARRASITDPLTGQWNYRYLSMMLNQEVERAHRFQRPLSVAMLDLDHFKRVNDTFGHAKGDAVLREFAQRVRSQIREVDTFARYGGEEFVLVLPETTRGGAERLAQRIAAAVGDHPFCTDSDHPVVITVSIGVAVFPINGSAAPLLLRAADKALYQAKRDGRNRVALATGVTV